MKLNLLCDLAISFLDISKYIYKSVPPRCTPCKNSYCLIYLVTHQYSITSVFFCLLAFLWSLMMLSTFFFMFLCHLDILYCSIFIVNYLSFWKTFYIFKTYALWLWCVQSNVLPLFWPLSCGEYILPLQGLHFHPLKNVFINKHS